MQSVQQIYSQSSRNNEVDNSLRLLGLIPKHMIVISETYFLEKARWEYTQKMCRSMKKAQRQYGKGSA